MPEFTHVGKAADFKRGEIYAFEVEGELVAVANCGGTVRAFARLCTHLDVDLTDGFVSGDHIYCPLHDSCFDLNTGEVISGPAANSLRIYAVHLEGDDVFVGAS
jgi:nitrite reductase/ring-hydroxylating ferredoxin subunit